MPKNRRKFANSFSILFASFTCGACHFHTRIRKFSHKRHSDVVESSNRGGIVVELVVGFSCAWSWSLVSHRDSPRPSWSTLPCRKSLMTADGRNPKVCSCHDLLLSLGFRTAMQRNMSYKTWRTAASKISHKVRRGYSKF